MRYVCVVGLEYESPQMKDTLILCLVCRIHPSSICLSEVRFTLCTAALESGFVFGCFLVLLCFHQWCKRLHYFSLTYFLSSWNCVVFFQGSEQKRLCSSSCFCLKWSALHSPVDGRRHRRNDESLSYVLALGSAPEVFASF